MAKKIELYIGGLKVDLDEDVAILLTKQFSDVFDPAKLKNDFSKTVSLPNTDNNNNIFGKVFDINKKIEYTSELQPLLKVSEISGKIIGNDIEQFFTFSAFNLESELEVEAEPSFLISVDQINWESSLSFTPINGKVSLKKIYVRLNEVVIELHDGLITLFNDKVKKDVYVYGENLKPELYLNKIEIEKWETGFRYEKPLQYKITGIYLLSDINIIAPSYFQLSLTKDGTYTDTLDISPIDGEVDVNIWVKLIDVVETTGQITHSSTILDDKFLSVFSPEETDFITEWNMTSTSFTLLTGTNVSDWDYDYYIDWGDGSPEEHITSFIDVGHTYPSTGIYIIRIRGSFPRIYINNNNSHRLKLLRIMSWGDVNFRSFERSYYGCDNLIYVPDELKNHSANSMSVMFYNCSSLNSPLNNWDVSSIDDFSFMFMGCSLFNQDLNNWDMSNATTLSSMFAGCSVFNGSINDWDVSNVTNMGYLFNSCVSFNQPLNNWDVSNVTNMVQLFRFCQSFNQNINDWDVSNVQSFNATFQSASVFNQPLNNWDVSSVTNTSVMFQNCQSFNQNINDWDVSNVTTMIGMFQGASVFNQPLNNWDVSSVTNLGSVFRGASAFNQNINDWDVENAILMSSLFRDASSFNQPLYRWNTPSCNNMNFMFTNASSFNQDLSGWCVPLISSLPSSFSTGSPLTVANIPVWGTCPLTLIYEIDTTTLVFRTGTDTSYNWDYYIDWGDGSSIEHITSTNNPTHIYSSTGTYQVKITGSLPHMSYLGTDLKECVRWGDVGIQTFEYTFANCTKLIYVPKTLRNVSNVKNMRSMFSYSTFNQNINDWDVSNVTNMRGMFQGASVFNQPLNNWDVSSVTDMGYVFAQSAFNQNINDWDVLSVTDMDSMFWRCGSFNQPLNNWNVSNVTDMGYVFAESVFNQNINDWDVSNVTNMRSMFWRCGSFNQPLNNWDVSNVTDMRSMFAESVFNQNINDWDVSNVTNMRSMFSYSTFNQPLNNWDVSNVTDMYEMFYNATIFNQDLSGWCVPLISFLPSSFSTGSPLTVDNIPVWGTCP